MKDLHAGPVPKPVEQRPKTQSNNKTTKESSNKGKKVKQPIAWVRTGLKPSIELTKLISSEVSVIQHVPQRYTRSDERTSILEHMHIGHLTAKECIATVCRVGLRATCSCGIYCRKLTFSQILKNTDKAATLRLCHGSQLLVPPLRPDQTQHIQLYPVMLSDYSQHTSKQASTKTDKINDQKQRETMESFLNTKQAFLKIPMRREAEATTGPTWLSKVILLSKIKPKIDNWPTIETRQPSTKNSGKTASRVAVDLEMIDWLTCPTYCTKY